jgi:hypothetical protein
MFLQFPDGDRVEVASEPVADVRQGQMVWRFTGHPYYTHRNCSGRVATTTSYVVPHSLLGVPGGVVAVEMVA